MVKARKFIFRKRSERLPKPTDFKLEDEELPPLKDGEYLAVYISVDPYMRAYMPSIPLNSTMIGAQVAKITESKNNKYPVGKYVVGPFGWRTHTIVKEDADSSGVGIPTGHPTYILPDLGDLPVSLGVGELGMPGNTAYFAFLEICQPKVGETVVISGAAGAVGSHVGQIAKNRGCKVIGLTGSDEKGKRLTQVLGFDHFINYKTQNVAEELTKIASNGIDCYFDNVGGEISSIVMNQMNDNGRVSVVGAISGYNEKEYPKVPAPQFTIVFKQLKVQGFLIWKWGDRWLEGIKINLELIKQGKLKYNETVTEGFENTFNAFLDMLKGGNFGKAVVKV